MMAANFVADFTMQNLLGHKSEIYKDAKRQLMSKVLWSHRTKFS
eukprot:SAG11_NODE_22534_length_404_cov_0.967213_1_plen_44_part_00